MSSTMALDNSLPRNEVHAERSPETTDADHRAWAEALSARDVEDKRFERSSRTPVITHSVTLWDEITPAPCEQPDGPDDSRER
jgi:hypothetical protein